ncbi:uncharacterized protein P884DRAFT_272328 [Thermothelomyces heterothallicus CBS 202.75]|uniref:uncharacterized protein n=1 Tax=Thermothelomyces heterothallicus CBS 202.75 TaxID=1149848 RepID=UPI0037431A5A
MHFTSIALLLAGAASTVLADCGNPSAPPSDGDIALYSGEDCSGGYLNVGALNSCQSWPNFEACSAITRKGVRCDIYKQDSCKDGFIATIDETGYRSFCGWVSDTVQSVRCYT